MLFLFGSCYLVSLLLPYALSQSITHIYDDLLGDIFSEDTGTTSGVQIAYQPAGAWMDNTVCRDWIPGLDTQQLTGKSWHASVLGANMSNFSTTANLNISSMSITFTGNGITVFCAILQATDGTQVNSNMSFTLDGSLVEDYWAPLPIQVSSSNISFDTVPVYSSGSLWPGSHQLVIETRLRGSRSIMVFDYIQYHVNESANVLQAHLGAEHLGHRQISQAGIAGIVIGIVALLSLGSVLLYRHQRERRLAKLLPSNHADLLVPPDCSGTRPGGKLNPFATNGRHRSHRRNETPSLPNPAFLNGLSLLSQPRSSLHYSQRPPSYDSHNGP